MHHQRQGVRSTKSKHFQAPNSSSGIGKKEKDVYATVVDLWDPTETIYTDQTGAFPTTAHSGARYIMVMVTIDANTILVCPIKNRSDQELRQAYLKLLDRAKVTGLKVKKHVLDNKCSNTTKELTRVECKLELVLPHCHRRNIAEAVIKHFKNRVISILSGVDPSFLLKLWDKLLTEATLTLHLLR